jgi:hypothetical protein
MILATDWLDVGLIAGVVIIADFILAIVIGQRLGDINQRLDDRHAIVVPDELGPDDRIVIWHKDEPPPPTDPEDTPRPKPIVGLE